MQDISLRCSRVRFSYPQADKSIEILDGIDFNVADQEFLSLVGPSGCGKTTLLRVLSGLLHPSAGSVELARTPENRPAASLVFQENGLFPWMTVIENAAFGLEMQGVSRAERERAASEMLAEFGLTGWDRSYPHQLSTGMKQRVAVARAFLTGAPVLLMDEPFAALDWQTRLEAQQKLCSFWENHRKTVIFVTHDVNEALILSDRILVLSPRPSRIAASFEVALPRPRGILPESDPQTLALKLRVLDALKLTHSGQLTPA